jgi:starch phosphorylase
VLVELYADGINDAKPERIKMEPDSDKSDNAEEHFYQATVETKRNATDFTVRVIPHYEGVSVPLEDNLIRWQH